MTDGTEPLRVDIVSDIVCPWCALGYHQLRTSLEQTGTAADIHWHPFELNPDLPPEGQDLARHLAEKYGTTEEASRATRARIARLGAEVGFRFDFHDGMRTYNTFAAHRLLHWARTRGADHALNLALFDAYFTQRRNVGDPDTLIELAGSVGLETTKAASVLGEDQFADEVRALQRFWLRQGVRGVPAMVFDSRHLVDGARGVDSYVAILRQLSPAPAA